MLSNSIRAKPLRLPLSPLNCHSTPSTLRAFTSGATLGPRKEGRFMVPGILDSRLSFSGIHLNSLCFPCFRKLKKKKKIHFSSSHSPTSPEHSFHPLQRHQYQRAASPGPRMEATTPAAQQECGTAMSNPALVLAFLLSPNTQNSKYRLF